MAHTEVSTWFMVGGAAVALIVAPIVLVAAPRRPVNRLLALYLGLIGLNFAADILGRFPVGERTSYNAFLYASITNLTVPLAYLLFVGAAVDSPFARPFKHAIVRNAILVIIGVATVGLVVFHETFLTRQLPAAFGALIGPLWIAVAALGLIAAIHAFVRAPKKTLARRRAKGYALAFGAQDLGFLFLPLYLAFVPHALHASVTTYGYGISLILAVGLLVRALLRDQLFDFELKVKWTLKQSTLAAIFIAVFFMVSEGAQQLFQESVGPYLGIAAAGLLVFLIAPLQNVAARIADAAMPQVQPTSTYIQYKKLEVYRSAVESALETGGIDERERAVLTRLREKLAIESHDARALEIECGDDDAPLAS